MKHSIFYVILMLFFISSAYSQTVEFDWAKRAGGSSDDYGTSITTDAAGNLYVTGQFRGTAAFIGSHGAITLTSAGDYDIFIAKYDQTTGAVLWAKRAGGSDWDFGNSITTDAAGNIYVTGDFSGTATFGAITLNSAGINDIFVAKYDQKWGNVLWAKRAGGSNEDEGNSIMTDVAGNLYVTGSFREKATFGTIKLTSAGAPDIFIAKYDPTTGDVLWAKRAGGGSGWDRGYSIMPDAAGNLYVTGYFSSTATFGAITLTSAGSADIFVAKYDKTSGDILWAKRAGGSREDHGNSITIDAVGNIYVTGDFKGTAVFGSTTLTSVGYVDIFVAKYNPTTGAVLWAKRAGGRKDFGENIGTNITIDAAGNLYVTGRFVGTATFGTITLISAGGADIFVAKYDQTTGAVLWAKRAGGGGYDMGYSITTDAADNLYVIGNFRGKSTFGTITLTSAGEDEIFITKIKEVNPVLSVHPTMLDFGETETSLSFEISNSGSGTLTWNVVEHPDKPWITSINPSSGTNNGTVTVTVDRSQLSGDSDTGTIAVTSNGGNANVTVLIEKAENPVLSVQPTILDFGETRISLPFEISNIGSGTLNWNIVENPEKSWITSINPSSGTNNATVIVTVDRSGLTADTYTGTITVYSNGGNANVSVRMAVPVFSEQLIICQPEADGANCVHAADLDGDGDMDVLSASNWDNKIACYENSGSGTFGSQQVISTAVNEAKSVYAADLDGDGDMDVLSASYTDRKIAWYENNGSGNFGSQQVITTAANGAMSVYAADLDSDGDMDVLSASAEDDKIAWYENDGSGTFGSQQVITSAADGPFSVYASDLDGDGDMDVLSASYYDDKIACYKNSGSGAFGSQQLITTAADGPFSVYAADLDGDGDIDVLSASANDDKIACYKNNGSGAFSSQQVITTAANNARSVYATDVDGDGDIDVLSASYSDRKIAWYENTGSGTFGAQRVITTAAEGAVSVYATDLDGDGNMDVLSASFIDDKIAWYENLLIDKNPVLSVQPTVLNFGTTKTSLSFEISNSGSGTLIWNAIENPNKPWITSINPASGMNNGTVTVTVDRSQLSGDRDTGRITITSNGGNANVTVLIQKDEAPILSVHPTTLNFGKTETSLSFAISNSGGGTLTWNVTENPDKPWITSINPASGTNAATVTVTVDRNQLNIDSTGTIIVASNGGNANVTVLIQKDKNPVLLVQPTFLDFGDTKTSLSFNISNTGSGTLTWNVTENPDKSWITSINPASGTNNATVTVTVDRSQLSGNSDTGMLVVTSNGGTQNIGVQINKQISGNLIVNGDFFNGDAGWKFSVINPARATGSVVNGEYAVSITNGGTESWHIQLSQSGLLLENGKKYMVSFEAYTTGSRSISSVLIKGWEGEWTCYQYRTFKLTTTKRKYKFEFRMNDPTDQNAVFYFDLGNSTENVYIDNVIIREKVITGDLVNGDFSDGDEYWLTWIHPEASAYGSVQNEAFVMSIDNGGSQSYHVQLMQTDLLIENGKSYNVSFDAYAEEPREIWVSVQHGSEPWTGYHSLPNLNLTTTRHTFSSSFTMSQSTDSEARLVFDVGLSDIDTYFDNITLTVGTTESFTYNFPQQGWYLISLPVTPEDNSLNTLFPNSYGAYAYNSNTGNYYSVTTLESQKGYWLLIPSATSVTISGVPLTSYTEHYKSGWHLIGSVNKPTGFTDPDDNPNGSIIAAYGWDINTGQYFSVYPPGKGKLEPKHGYWLAVIQACDLTVGAGSIANAKMTVSGDVTLFQKRFGAEPPVPPFLADRHVAQPLPISELSARNYPNPFNPETVIEYSIPNAGLVNIYIYNALGQKIRTLLEQERPAGIYRVIWDSRDDSHNLVSNGIYFYCIMNAGEMRTGKMLLMK